MTEFAVIPKLLKPRKSLSYNQKIPKIIWQTISTNRVPSIIKKYSDSWIDLNPEYEYRFFDNEDIIDFLKKDFPEYVGPYNKLKYGASKADLWRYLIIYKYGGVYADMDCKCLNSLRNWIDPTASLVTQLGINKDLCQWLIISEPKNPVFLKAAQQTLFNSINNNYYTTHYGFELDGQTLIYSDKLLEFNHPVLGLSGPPILQNAAEQCYKDGSWSEILPYIQVTGVSSAGNFCNMNGNVIHDTRNKEYKESYKKLKLIHYNSRIERIKRIITNLLSFKITTTAKKLFIE
jgi:hypothetical protein